MQRVTPRGGLAIAFVAALLTACGGAQSGRTTERQAMVEARERGRAYAEFVQAEMLAEREAWPEAIAAYRQAVRLDPVAALPRLRLASALWQGAGEELDDDTVRDALHQARTAGELGSRPAEVAIVTSNVHQAAGDVDAALAALHAAAALDHGDAELFEHCYDIADDAERTSEMVRCTEAYIEAYPRRPLAWRFHGFALRADEQLREAAEAFAYATTLPDGDPRNAVDQILTLEELEDWDAAIGAAIGCRTRFRDHIECYAREALLRDREREDNAPLSEATRAAIDRLTARSAGNLRSLWRAARVLESDGRPGLVVGYAEEIARQRPFNVSLLSQAAWMCVRVDREDEAIALMTRVLELDESNFSALNFIGYSWADAGENLELAEEYIRRAVFLRPDSGSILDSLAWVLYRTGRYEEALETQLRAVELDEESAVLWDHLGDIYMALGRPADAIPAYERALEIGTAYDEDVLETVPAKLRDAREQAGTS